MTLNVYPSTKRPIKAAANIYLTYIDKHSYLHTPGHTNVLYGYKSFIHAILHQKWNFSLISNCLAQIFNLLTADCHYAHFNSFHQHTTHAINNKCKYLYMQNFIYVYRYTSMCIPYIYSIYIYILVYRYVRGNVLGESPGKYKHFALGIERKPSEFIAWAHDANLIVFVVVVVL